MCGHPLDTVTIVTEAKLIEEGLAARQSEFVPTDQINKYGIKQLFDPVGEMSFAAKNQTNPAVTDATGYTPYIKARTDRANATGGCKANVRAQAIRDYWQREHCLEDLADYSRDHGTNLFRNQWECEADRKALYSRVRWEMGKITSKMDKDLEQRRARLSDLLQSEEAIYLDEMSIMQHEDPDVKKERMLQRYAELKMQKEIERQKVAQVKKDQQFKRNCDELRELVSHKIQRETAQEGRKIVLEKEQEKLEQNREDAMYAKLWARDREAKDLKDTQEAQEKRKKDLENGRFIQDQILKNKLERQKKLKEKENDAAVIEEQKRLAALEEHYEKERKKRKQAEMKLDLDMCTREKLKRKAKEVQDDLLQDLFFMKQIAENEGEAAKCEKKRALLHEQKQYLKYLEDQVKAEAKFEKEVDQMYQEEVDQMWKKRELEWQEEKSKRRQLEKDVLDEVQKQIQNNMEKSRRVQELSQLYAQKVLDEDKEDGLRASEKLRLIRERNSMNQRELLDQIKAKQEKLEQEKIQRDYELQIVRRERKENERKIQQLLSEMKIDNEHPFRGKAREIC